MEVKMCPCESLEKLIDGNKRFAQNKSIHPNLGEEMRNALLKEQKPYAAILACSDSRVPVEIIFDAGLGDLFVVRSAGHVLSNEALGSLEYAVKELGVKLIVILGHENCGAITTALKVYNSGGIKDLSENMLVLLSHIFPAIKNTDVNSSDVLETAINANVHYQLNDLIRKNNYLAKRIEDGKLILVGAKYSLSTGLVEICDERENNLCIQ